MYKKEDHIETADTGKMFGHNGGYRYRVLGRDGQPVHHTNNLKDAEDYFEKCKALWIARDKEASRGD